mgnify:CR=1 FL=1
MDDNIFRCMICDELGDYKEKGWSLKYTKDLSDRNGWEYDEGIDTIVVCEECYFQETHHLYEKHNKKGN